MKVKDLVTRLAKLDQNSEIYIYEPVADSLFYIVDIADGLILDGLYYTKDYAKDSHPAEIIEALDNGEGSEIAVIEI